MRIVMYAHGGSMNHGCEAIVRSTTNLLKELDARPLLLSYKDTEEQKYAVQRVVDVRQEIHEIDKKSVDFIRAYLMQKITGQYYYMDALLHKQAIDNLDQKDVALFVGGDNYCYSDVKNYAYINNYIRKKADKLVLWGASVEPKLLEDRQIRKDLERFDLIVAREGISYDVLRQVNSQTVWLPDPAFYLPIEKCELPKGFQPNITIGINISPLIMEHEKRKGMVISNYKKLIEYILEETDYLIALIPHVVWGSNDDRKPLQKLYEIYKESNRMLLIEDHNCMQLKYMISNCRMFIGARTHATIAAYSTAVPTLVVGYSVKARGIAKDLFDIEENYVISVQSLEQEDILLNAYLWMEQHEDLIRKNLQEKMDIYKDYRSKYVRGLENVCL